MFTHTRGYKHALPSANKYPLTSTEDTIADSPSTTSILLYIPSYVWWRGWSDERPVGRSVAVPLNRIMPFYSNISRMGFCWLMLIDGFHFLYGFLHSYQHTCCCFLPLLWHPIPMWTRRNTKVTHGLHRKGGDSLVVEWWRLNWQPLPFPNLFLYVSS